MAPPTTCRSVCDSGSAWLGYEAAAHARLSRFHRSCTIADAMCAVLIEVEQYERGVSRLARARRRQFLGGVARDALGRSGHPPFARQEALMGSRIEIEARRQRRSIDNHDLFILYGRRRAHRGDAQFSAFRRLWRSPLQSVHRRNEWLMSRAIPFMAATVKRRRASLEIVLEIIPKNRNG
jgi:hypothetical protein